VLLGTTVSVAWQDSLMTHVFIQIGDAQDQFQSSSVFRDQTRVASPHNIPRCSPLKEQHLSILVDAVTVRENRCLVEFLNTSSISGQTRAVVFEKTSGISRLHPGTPHERLGRHGSHSEQIRFIVVRARLLQIWEWLQPCNITVYVSSEG